MLRCVNCGLYGNKKQIKDKVVKSELSDNYYRIPLCQHCYDQEHITVRYGKKELLTESE